LVGVSLSESLSMSLMFRFFAVLYMMTISVSFSKSPRLNRAQTYSTYPSGCSGTTLGAESADLVWMALTAVRARRVVGIVGFNWVSRDDGCWLLRIVFGGDVTDTVV
jgi:hypothetical protein